MQIAKTILDQIKGLDKMALHAWGAKDMVAMNDGLKFKTSGMVRWKGWVYIKLDPARDLYDIDFFKIRKYEVKYTKRIEGVYFDQLIELIDEVVG